MMHSKHLALAVAWLAVAGCSDGLAGGPSLAIDVAALQLDGVDNARYVLSVRNESDELVWTRTIDSAAYGDGQGAVSYVGPCDAEDDPSGDGDATNTVELAIDALFANGQLLTAGVDFVNPAPVGAPVSRDAVCRADQDAAVTFDLTVARRASQGFFDIAVSFKDIFCSAKLDCVDDDGQPLELLFDGGERGRTVVLGFACTTGLGTETHLYMDPVDIECGAAGSVTLDPDTPAGNKGAVPPIVFQHALFVGEEQLSDGGTSWGKVYWNLAIGIDETALSATDPCVLSTSATAASPPFDGGAAPAGAVWPRVDWSVTLNSVGNTSLTCLGEGLDDVGSGVTTAYGQGDAFSYELAPSGVPGQAPTVTRVDQGTVYASCAALKAADPGLTGVGVYTVDLGAGSADVLCDMSSLDGGWTLVAVQFESDPIRWDEGRQADYDPTLVSRASFALTGADLPTHTELAFGQVESSGVGTFAVTTLDRFPFIYTTGNIAKTEVTGASGASYHIHRDRGTDGTDGTWYPYHDPEAGPRYDLPMWQDTLTIDASGVYPGYTFSYSPQQPTSTERGFAFDGVALRSSTPDTEGWAVWVR